MSPLDVARRTGRQVAWFVRGMVREDAYEKYVAHVMATHPDDQGRQLMTERMFWREQTDRQDANPEGRCC